MTGSRILFRLFLALGLASSIEADMLPMAAHLHEPGEQSANRIDRTLDCLLPMAAANEQDEWVIAVRADSTWSAGIRKTFRSGVTAEFTTSGNESVVERARRLGSVASCG